MVVKKPFKRGMSAGCIIVSIFWIYTGHMDRALYFISCAILLKID